MRSHQKAVGSRQFASDIDLTDWAFSARPVAYDLGVRIMTERARLIARGGAPELVWLLEHPPIYTAGTSTKASDVLDPKGIPIHQTGRGGRITYHGPGQRVAYVMLNLKCRGADVRAFVHALEQWLIDALRALGVEGETRPGRVGIWVARPQKGGGREDKIAAIGLRLTNWVSLHGISLNVKPNLAHYDGIVPCGIAEHGVTSLADLGVPATIEAVDKALRDAFEHQFGTTCDVDDPLPSSHFTSPMQARSHP